MVVAMTKSQNKTGKKEVERGATVRREGKSGQREPKLAWGDE